MSNLNKNDQQNFSNIGSNNNNNLFTLGLKQNKNEYRIDPSRGKGIKNKMNLEPDEEMDLNDGKFSNDFYLFLKEFFN